MEGPVPTEGAVERPETMDRDVERARTQLAEVAAEGRLLVLSGAGISAESQIPTFRGKEGYWTRGSKVYHPMELATRAAFEREPATVWGWYLYRRGVCRAAVPNAGHRACTEMARALRDRFRLVTQNVDGLHGRAGTPPEVTYEIHGNIDRFRCARRCRPETYPVPDRFDGWARDAVVSEDDLAALSCPACGGPGRPHVLWFDECYDEELFHADSTLEAASRADLLLVVGTSGATNLPLMVGNLAARRGIPIWDVNPEAGPFAELAAQSPGGHIAAPAAAVLPQLAEAVA